MFQIFWQEFWPRMHFKMSISSTLLAWKPPRSSGPRVVFLERASPSKTRQTQIPWIRCRLPPAPTRHTWSHKNGLEHPNHSSCNSWERSYHSLSICWVAQYGVQMQPGKKPCLGSTHPCKENQRDIHYHLMHVALYTNLFWIKFKSTSKYCRHRFEMKGEKCPKNNFHSFKT